MTTSTSATSSKKSTQAPAPIVANPANVPQSLAPVVPPTVPAPSLLAKLQSQAPAVATSAQLASAIGTVQGAYQAIQNGISAPTRGSSCIAVWVAYCNYCVQHQQAPTLAQLAPQLSAVNPTTQSVQYYKVRKYFGL